MEGLLGVSAALLEVPGEPLTLGTWGRESRDSSLEKKKKKKSDEREQDGIRAGRQFGLNSSPDGNCTPVHAASLY